MHELEIRRLEEKEFEPGPVTAYHFYTANHRGNGIGNCDEWNEIWKLIYFRFYRSGILSFVGFIILFAEEINWRKQILLRLHEHHVAEG